MDRTLFDRRSVLKGLAATSLVSCLQPGSLLAKQEKKEKIWACLLHLSFNMWESYISPHRPFRGYRPDLELSEALWNDSLNKMAQAGMNMVLIDVGDAVKYESHPEIAVNNAWSTKRLQDELDKIRKMGLESIPKLNFSATHDTWLGPYARMVSTKKYYDVCSDIIAEVVDLFDNPRFFHLGMDEETASHQRHHKYVVLRQKDLWWGDFYFLLGEVEKNGSRAWIWSDYMWDHKDEFLKKMPKSVVQSNWYYRESFEKSQKYVKAYLDLEAHGYDQIPTGSFHTDNEKSILNTIKFCNENIAPERLMGFLQTLWKPTIEEHRDRYLKGIDLTGEGKKWFDKNHK